VRYTKIPFFLEGKEREREREQQQQHSLGSQNGCKIPNWRVISYTVEKLAIIEWVWKSVLGMMKLPAAQYQHNLRQA